MGAGKKTTDVSNFHGPGDFVKWADWMARQKSSPSKRKDRTSASLEPSKTQLKTQVDTQVDTERKLVNMTRTVTPRARKRLKLRTIDEIFGNEKCQEYYINALKESLEKMNLSKLHQFILDHQTYGKSSHASWNTDFANMVNISPPEEYQGRNEAHTHSRIVAAAQYFLVKAHKADVFQITLTKKQINPWIFIDGKMGPYTVSVLGEYGNSQHKTKRGKDKKLETHGDAKLDEDDYKKGSASHRSYEEAREYKRNQLHPTDSNAKKLYARLDRFGDEVKSKELVINKHSFDTDMHLSTALGIAYGENPKPDNTRDSRNLFRVLNLLAQKVGAEVDEMDIEAGDTLDITSQGEFSITKYDGELRYSKIKLS